MSKSSLLSKMSNFREHMEAKGYDFNPCLVIGVESDMQGAPQAVLVQTAASPYITLGMIMEAERQLEELKQEVFSRMKRHKSDGSMPEELREKIENLRKEADKAMEDGDESKLRDIRAQLLKFLTDKMGENLPDSIKDLKKKSDEEDFNVNDFLGGI